jgi:hypothetical protein
MKRVLIILSLLLLFSSINLSSQNFIKVKPESASHIYFKVIGDDNQNSSLDRNQNSLPNPNNKRPFYKLNVEQIEKLKFLNVARKYPFKNGVLVDDNGNQLYRNDAIYLRLKEKINLYNYDTERAKKYTLNTGIPLVDNILLNNGLEKVYELLNFPQNISNKKISNETQQIKEALQRTYEVKLNDIKDLIQLCIDLALLDIVEYAEPIPIMYLHSTPNDTRYNEQFALDLMDCPDAWSIFKGENSLVEITIGVCDSGTDWDHPDLRDNLKQNLDEDANGNGQVIIFQGGQWILDPGDLNGIDDDGNGYIDDLIGWNFYTSDGTSSSNPMGSSDNNHGTHVAGICNARTNNSLGVAGLPWNVKFIPTKHGDNSDGRYIYYGYEGIGYLAHQGCDVINCSWGGGGYAATENDIMTYVYGLGTIVIVSAGNNNNNNIQFPAAYQKTVAVASINSSDNKAYYSSFGYYVDIAAYGGESTTDGGILSTLFNDTYGKLQGTSMASPYAAALAGYIKAYNPLLSNDEVLLALMGTTIDINSSNPDYQDMLGYGKINAYNAITTENPDIPNVPEIDLFSFNYIESNGNGLIENGETVHFLITFRNFNQFHGTNNFSYQVITDDPDITIYNGSGSFEIYPDAFFDLSGLAFDISNNCPTKIAKFKIKISFDGIDKTYLSSILIINSATTQQVYGYIVYDPWTGITGPVKFKINEPGNWTLIADQSSQPWIRGATYFNNNWYCYTSDNKIVTINPNNGNRTNIASYSKAFSGLGYSHNANKLYGQVFQGEFSELKLSPASIIKKFDYTERFINLAIDKKGKVYRIDISNESLTEGRDYEDDYKILGYFDYDLNYTQDMEYDPNTDVIYASLYSRYDESFFVAIDKEYGWYFIIGSFKNNAEITGLVFPNTYSFSGVVLSTPEYDKKDITKEQSFSWSAFTGANSYKVIISYNEDYSLIIRNITTTSNNITISPPLIKGKRYFWKVEAYNGTTKLAESQNWTFTTVAPEYCTPNSENCEEYIGKVKFRSIDEQSDCSYFGYDDKTYIETNVRRNRTYPITIINPNPFTNDKVAVFIDWNQDKSFNTTTERYILSTSDYETFTGNITVPNDAVLGKTVMRVRINYVNIPEPCSNQTYGEAEDYTLNVESPVNYQSISLNAGWNTISTFIIPNNSNMSKIWEDINNKVVIVKNNLGQTYIPSYGINNIGNWNLHQGYLAFLNSTIILEIEGTTCTPQNESISVINGWNTIAYVRTSNMNIATALVDLTNQDALVIAKNHSGQVYIPSFGINTIGNMLPGQGYKMFCSKNTTFKYPN